MSNHNDTGHGTPGTFREYIHEMLGQAQIQAELGMTHAEIGDDVGLEYTVRRLAAYFRAAVATLKDLKEMTGGGDA